ncbi:glucokinase [Arthrobacter sp. CAN_A212]|uniref:ROK family protein n=1 Tax=unclassified Arthrobacter TaxID=235627 RepID=UPI0018CA74EA|nr:ROK family protein [Arthrobacter sp. CAN_C5]MBP2217658.1 glucokinase [Arthrobacter sp. CAN_C5]
MTDHPATTADPAPAPATDLVLAIDVGGTDLKSALADPDGTLLDIRRTPTPAPSCIPGESIVERAAELLADYRAAWPAHRIGAIGLIAPGLVDEVNGVGIYSANLGWRDFPFAQRLQEATGLPVTYAHDVGAAGDAEMRFGAARGFADVVVVIIGTGIAGAVFCGGVRVQAGGYAGELGHARVPGGLACTCGVHGCLETLGSAGAIARRYADQSNQSVTGAQDVFEAAAAGDPAAQQVIDDAVAALAFSISQLVAILGTEAVVIGGGLAQAGEALFGPLRRELEGNLSFHRRPVLLAARMGQDAGLIGAALRARSLLDAP